MVFKDFSSVTNNNIRQINIGKICTLMFLAQKIKINYYCLIFLLDINKSSQFLKFCKQKEGKERTN